METMLLAIGMDIADIQKFLGHANISATRIYADQHRHAQAQVRPDHRSERPGPSWRSGARQSFLQNRLDTIEPRICVVCLNGQPNKRRDNGTADQLDPANIRFDLCKPLSCRALGSRGFGKQLGQIGVEALFLEPVLNGLGIEYSICHASESRVDPGFGQPNRYRLFHFVSLLHFVGIGNSILVGVSVAADINQDIAFPRLCLTSPGLLGRSVPLPVASPASCHGTGVDSGALLRPEDAGRPARTRRRLGNPTVDNGDNPAQSMIEQGVSSYVTTKEYGDMNFGMMTMFR